ncbi:dTDP-4-dehydrorhamnose reductase [Selenomonas caprae]|uniref:dTDP-4-dehydrorhamnose reductase n=1 Tax=Selenomonas caprae TaxID=2606905 RepID=A0A5D6WT14_9FIRM|nr:dTDP-4-dehydrorhamnose reductase [Selenomonas caprae]MBQ1889309.1 dTDP-4-dehydrorhamnose reductase [Selenomonas sp.]TYZ31093.1 dTDP-4-dehydrorhamnose reductase [Selenomonas caprae]
MKVLVTGVTGQLGYDCVQELERRGIEVRGVASRDFSLTDHAAAKRYIETYRPDVIIHCAAYTAVDKAEDEQEICEAINAEGTRNLAKIAQELAAKMIYISTDYVFPGDGERFYEPADKKEPQNAYGLSKLHGEEAVQELVEKYFIVRISWVFGINGRNFIRTMLKLAETHDTLTVVDDQIGSPTYTHDLAVLLADMAQSDKYGVYHATNEGVCSWAELAAETFRQAGRKVTVTPVPSSAYPTKAVRPKNSRMSKDCLEAAGFHRLPAWQDAVGRYLHELNSKAE